MQDSLLNGTLKELGFMDIYLLDQIQKGRITKNSKLLDAGCGHGRNMEYFVRHGLDIRGIDSDNDSVVQLKSYAKEWNPEFSIDRLSTGVLENLPYADGEFDFVFSVAVLHFARSHTHFLKMLDELLRVLKSGGMLMFRMTTWHTFDKNGKTESGLFTISHGQRYLLDIVNLKDYIDKKGLTLLDPVKTTNVDDKRAMTTIVLQK